MNSGTIHEFYLIYCLMPKGSWEEVERLGVGLALNKDKTGIQIL